jgi:hypothetical protein
MSLDLFHLQRLARYQRCQQQTSKTAQLGVVPTHLPLQLPDRLQLFRQHDILARHQLLQPFRQSSYSTCQVLVLLLADDQFSSTQLGNSSSGMCSGGRTQGRGWAAGLRKVAVVVGPKLEARAAGFGMG